MATNNGGRTARGGNQTGGVKPKHQAAANKSNPNPAVEERQAEEEVVPTVTGAETDMASADDARNYIFTREGTRKIKLHSRRKIMGSVDEAVVKTTGGAPDMRFAENRLGLMADPSKKKTGEDDFRFLENRPDILALHASRGETFPNLLFDEDGNVQGAGQELVGALKDNGEGDDEE